MRRSSLLLLALLVACHSTQRPDAGRISPNNSVPTATGSTPLASSTDLADMPADARETVLADVTNELLKMHVRAHAIDDVVSKEAFQRLLDEVDSSKLFLLESDVQKLARFETDMDDELKAGNLSLGRKAVVLLASRRRVVAGVIAQTLATPLTFTENDTLETDPKKRAFCKSEEELAARWRSVLKEQVLERTQELADSLEKKKTPATPKDPDDAKREAAAVKALGEIPTTFEGQRDKVQKEIAARYATQFKRLESTDKLDPAQMFINAVNGAFDPHTNYLPPAQEAELDIAMTGRLEGIGATLREQEHYILVYDLVPGGAAFQQGRLEVGDLIQSVAQEGKEPVDVMDMPINKVVAMIRGPKGTVVVLKVKKSDGRLETISITRDVVRVEATYARGAILKTKVGEVGYVYLPGFYGDSLKPGERNATGDMRAILTELTKKGASSLVFDLRGNGGGLLTHARDIAGLFISEGPVVQTKDSRGKVDVLRDQDKSITFSGEVVVLVDRFCASAAEIVAGALQDYGRAVIVGTSATHGKGTVQSVIDLDRQLKTKGDPLGLFKVTVQEYFRVSGGSTQLKGVVPDVLLPDPTSFVDSGERTLPHAIPWSTIDPVAFAKVPHTWKVSDLSALSTARTSANADFAPIAKFGSLMEARKDKTLKVLERTAWQAEYAKTKSELEALDPKKRDRKPLMQVALLGAQAAVQDPRSQKQVEKWQSDLAGDLWVEESTHILADMKKAR